MSNIASICHRTASYS